MHQCITTFAISFIVPEHNKKLSERSETGRQQCTLCTLVTFYRRNDLHQRPAPTSNYRPIYYARSEYARSMRQYSPLADARPHCGLMSPFQRTPANARVTLHCLKLESMNYMTVSLVCVYLYLFLHTCFRNPRKDLQHERLTPPPQGTSTNQWSFRKIGTMGTLGPKDRSSRPEGSRQGVLVDGSRAPSSPARRFGSAVNCLSGVRGSLLAQKSPENAYIAGTNFVYFQSTNMRLELQNPVDYYNNKKAVLSQGNRAMPQLFFSV